MALKTPICCLRSTTALVLTTPRPRHPDQQPLRHEPCDETEKGPASGCLLVEQLSPVCGVHAIGDLDLVAGMGTGNGTASSIIAFETMNVRDPLVDMVQRADYLELSGCTGAGLADIEVHRLPVDLRLVVLLQQWRQQQGSRPDPGRATAGAPRP